MTVKKKHNLDRDTWASENPVQPVRVLHHRQWNDKTGKYDRVEIEHHTRRARDARVWQTFSPAEEVAAEQLALGRAAQLSVLGLRAQSLTPRVDKTRGKPDTHKTIELERRYTDWVTQAKRDRISVTLTVAVVCEGMSLSQAERHYPRTRKTISKHMHDGVKLYLEMFPKPV